MEYEPNQRLDKYRGELEFLFKLSKHDQIACIPQIKIITMRRELPDDDCCSYALGIAWGKEGLKDKINSLLILPEVQIPQEGDYVLYFNFENNFTHLGIMQSETIVHSKWNDSHVFEHPIFLVPSSFGNQVRFVRISR